LAPCHKEEKKQQFNKTLPALKTVPNKSNKFIALSPLAHSTRAAPSHQILPPRPKSHDITRPHKGKADPKRWRGDDDFHHEPIIPPTPPSNHASISHQPIITPSLSTHVTS